MKKSMRLFAFILVMLLILGLIGCTPDATQTTGSAETAGTDEESTQEGKTEESTEGETLSPEEQILAERRDTVVEYMRKMLTVLWRAEKDMDYQLHSGMRMPIKAGCIYSGLPYTNGCGTMESFLAYASAPDKKGVYTISAESADVVKGALGGNSATLGKLGNDCSAAVFVAWAQIGASITSSNPEYMCEKYGLIKVGEYETKFITDSRGAELLDDTQMMCMDNGKDVMNAAYAKLQKGDAVVTNPQSGDHVMMVVDVKVVYDKNEKIDGKKSFITVIDQSRTDQANGKWVENAELGEKVYVIGQTEHGITFQSLYDKGYLPYTCKELIDPSPVPEPYVNDSETEYGFDKLLIGTFTSNWAIDRVKLTIKDNTGKVVQEATATSARGSWEISDRERQREFNLQQLVADEPSALSGKVDPNALAAGSYHCEVVCRLMNGQEFVVRDFDFTK